MKYAPLVGRILFAAIFLMFGMGHLTDSASMTGMVPSFLPAANVIVILTGIVIIVAGLGVLVGYKAKLSALVLFFFMLSTTILVHGAGFAGGDQIGTAMFMKDLSIAGAALLIFHFGAGPMSMDERSSS